MGISIYFISDLHLGHTNILPFRGPIHGKEFKDIYEHNEWLVDNWNSVVKKKNDIVWVLGDVCWGNESMHYLAQMNGLKNLILGNHDTQRHKVQEFLRYFSGIHATVKKYGFVMTHIPIHPNELLYRGWEANVHGHVHHIEKQNLMDQKKYFNMCVDIIGPRPIKLEALKERICK